MSTGQTTSEKARRWSVVLVIGLVVLLAFSVSRLFSLRFARGDIYPPYSSLRTDPLGTKALAEAINELPGFTVQRNFRQLSRLKLKEPATLIYVGIDYKAPIDENEFEKAIELVKAGARLIVTFTPELAQKAASTSSTKTPPAAGPAATPSPAATPKPTLRRVPGFLEDKTLFHEAATKEWGVSFDISEGNNHQVTHTEAVPEKGETYLEPSIPWHTALFFKDFNPEVWRTLFWSDGEAVVIERDLGHGSIVLSSDSYFLSNEGLHNARAPKLITRMIGNPPRTVIFDEFHNGVSEDSNIAGLARKYGLGGTILALFGVAALFIWKNAIPFLPSQKSAEAGDSHVVGLDASSGFINLLRRGVPANQILAACINEWRKSRGSRIREEELAHVESVMRGHEGKSAFKNAAAAYRTIAAGLDRR